MYCRMCGTLLEETDLFCSVCGAKTDKAKAAGFSVKAEEVVFPAPCQPDEISSVEVETEQMPPEKIQTTPESRKKTEEFQWNIYDFPKPKRTEDIDFHWGLEQTANKEEKLPLKEAEAPEDSMGRFLDEELAATEETVTEIGYSEAGINQTKENTAELEADIFGDWLEDKAGVADHSRLFPGEPAANIAGDVNKILANTGDAYKAVPMAAETGTQKAPIDFLENILTPAVRADEFMQRPVSEELADELLQRPASPASEERADKFYTFSKKNEEFQKLLDREYAKIRERENGPSIADNAAIRRRMQENTAAVQGIPGAAAATEEAVPREEPATGREDSGAALEKGAAPEGIAEEFAAFAGRSVELPASAENPFVGETMEKALPEKAGNIANAQPVQTKPDDLAARLEALWGKEETTELKDGKREPSLIAASFAIVKDVAPKEDGAKAEIAETAEAVGHQDAPAAVKAAAAIQVENGSEIEDTQADLTAVAADDTPDNVTAEPEATTAPEMPGAPTMPAAPAEPAKFTEVAEAKNTENVAETQALESDEEPLPKIGSLDDIFGDPRKSPVIMGTGWDDASGKTKKKPKKHGCSFVLLIIVIILLLIEIAALGVKMFLPDTAAAEFVGESQAKVIVFLTDASDTLSGWFNKDNEETEKPTDTEGTAEETGSGAIEPEAEPAPQEEIIDHSPTADLDTLVASQLYANKNIGEVMANAELKYVHGRDYGQADINNSVSIVDNYWTTAEDGEILYYDRKLVETLIGFDSAWNDYVNGGKDTVLSYTKEDSTAYKNAKNYSKVGKVTQVFRLLEIGEIRQGVEAFYVWAYEEISETQDGSTTEKKYHWIYQLETVGNEMKIVNYYKY